MARDNEWLCWHTRWTAHREQWLDNICIEKDRMARLGRRSATKGWNHRAGVNVTLCFHISILRDAALYALFTHVNDPICSHLPRPMRSLEGWHWSNRLLRYYLSVNIISDRSTSNTIIGFHIRDENKELFVGSWSVMHFFMLFITFYFSFYCNFIKLRQANNFYCFELSFHNNYTDRWKPDEKSIGSIADECLCVLKRIFSWSLTLSLHRKQERFFHCNADFYNMQLILISCIR